jgi:hypothetical protein
LQIRPRDPLSYWRFLEREDYIYGKYPRRFVKSPQDKRRKLEKAQKRAEAEKQSQIAVFVPKSWLARIDKIIAQEAELGLHNNRRT